MAKRDWLLLSNAAVEVAPRLLGTYLVRQYDGHELVGKIVEVEAYDQQDAASHSYKGRTPRTDVMFGAAGHLYVYFTYGMHYCCNVVTGQVGHGSAVLIRAIEPLDGLAAMRSLRHGMDDLQLTNGPAKLCQALAIDKRLNGHNLQEAPLQLRFKPQLAPHQIVQTTRIGITKDIDRPWRFYINDSPYVSKIA